MGARLPLAASTTLHALFILVVLTLPARLPRKADAPRRVEVVFYKPAAPAPEPQPEPEPIEVALEPPAPPPPAKLKAPPVPTPPPVEAQPQIARNEPPPRVEPAPPPLPKPAEPKRVVHTDVFRDSATAAAEPPRPAVVQTAGFGVASLSSRAPRKEEKVVVRSAGFKDAAATVSQRETAAPRGGSPIRAGFGGVVAAEPAKSAGQGVVKTAGFGEVAAAAQPKAKREKAAESPDTAVEVVSKATPTYTAEARRQRIEGAVVLEVTFVATGEMRVLRVVESLGHGLDEAAVEAAQKTRFKPARRDGRPVDHTTTLRVVFRLA